MIAAPRQAHRGYTLIEVLVAIVILGILASLVIPALGGSESLRTQAAVRTIVADIVEMQSEALAYQEKRAIVFLADEHKYIMVQVPGDEVDVELNALRETKISGADFGTVLFKDCVFDDDAILIFDEMGSPIASASDDAPAASGSMVVAGGGQSFRITVEAFTGRVAVTRE